MAPDRAASSRRQIRPNTTDSVTVGDAPPTVALRAPPAGPSEGLAAAVTVKGGGDADNQPPSKVVRARRDLCTAPKSPGSPGAEMAEKLAAHRKAREEARAKLESAQKDLMELVTERQEAVIVTAGLLE